MSTFQSLGECDRDAHVVDLCEGSMETEEEQFREQVRCPPTNVYIGLEMCRIGRDW